MADTSWLGPPIDVRPLFARQQAAFIDLLHGFGPAEWTRPTACPGWDVKDVAAHVLGDHIGRLSRSRDGHPSPPPRDGEALPAFLDRINGEWVHAARRISPQLLTEQTHYRGPGGRPLDMSAVRAAITTQIAHISDSAAVRDPYVAIPMTWPMVSGWSSTASM
jgi:uncharacterized protein (TIGR03083 family)